MTLYVLAHICMHASPSNRAREVFLKKIKPQLSYNDGAFKKMLSNGAEVQDDGTVRYSVDTKRFDDFFTALSCGIIFKTCKKQVPENYFIHHQYPNFVSDDGEPSAHMPDFFQELLAGEPTGVLNFGKPNTQNERIYTVKVFGMPGFGSSITVIHLFYGKFKVVSLLTNFKSPETNSSD